jgi:DNA-binding response OmpR family regulator
LLIVEDDDSVRSGWDTIFSQRGWDVVTARSVAEGLSMLDPAPDYLILDLCLPDGDGSAVLRRVRETNLKTRVAVTTGDKDARRLKLVRDLKPEAIFLKPCDVSDVWCEGEVARAS